MAISRRKNKRKRFQTTTPKGKVVTIRLVDSLESVKETDYKHRSMSPVNPETKQAFVDLETNKGYVSTDGLASWKDAEYYAFHEWLHCKFPSAHENTIKMMTDRLFPDMYRMGMRFWQKKD